MNAQAKEITAATEQTVVKTMKLTDLYLSELNPRQTASDEDTQLMADSLATVGLIHPVAGLLDKAGKVGIVAGGRRLRGLLRTSHVDSTVSFNASKYERQF